MRCAALRTGTHNALVTTGGSLSHLLAVMIWKAWCLISKAVVRTLSHGPGRPLRALAPRQEIRKRGQSAAVFDLPFTARILDERPKRTRE